MAELAGAARLTLDADSLAREVAIYAERCDISEEVARLGSHIQQFRDLAIRTSWPAASSSF